MSNSLGYHVIKKKQKAAEDKYVRPSGWLPLPEIIEGEQKFAGLIAVYESDNFLNITLTTTGSALIDWGDGNTQTVGTGNYFKTYDFNQIPAETWHERGYRQAIVTVTALTGDITFFAMHNRHPQMGGGSGSGSYNWLDIEMSMPFLTILNIRGTTGSNTTTIAPRVLERFYYKGTNNISGANTTRLFLDCIALQFCDVAIGGSTVNTFGNCYKLIEVNLREMGTRNPIDATQMFINCFNLRTLGDLDFTGFTSMPSVFNSCINLEKIKSIKTPNVLTVQSMFWNCANLRELPDGLNLSTCQNMITFCSGCNSLKKIPSLNVQNVTNANNAFQGCVSLTEVGVLNFSSVTQANLIFAQCRINKSFENVTFGAGLTQFTRLFEDCNSLKEIPAYNCQNVTDFGAGSFPTNIANNAVNCSRVKLLNIGVSLSVQNFFLNRDAIIEIFNNLQTVAGQTINITSNRGATQLTQADRDIAINKGWTIVG
jgi:hypothetical protein